MRDRSDGEELPNDLGSVVGVGEDFIECFVLWRSEYGVDECRARARLARLRND